MGRNKFFNIGANKNTMKNDVKKNKRNYPKKRKSRNTDYSMTQKVIKKVGKDKLREILLSNGVYSSAQIISKLYGSYVHFTTTSYLRKKFNWIREVSSKDESLAKSVLSGRVKPDHYKYIKFSEEILDELNTRQNTARQLSSGEKLGDK